MARPRSAIAIRSLLGDTRSVALALLALSLGIGATTVIVSIADSMWFNAFPFKDSSRVVHFFIQGPNQPSRSAWYPAPEFAAYREQNSVFGHVLGGVSMEVLYNLDNETHRARGALIDPQALRALGLTPTLGRDMTDADGAPEAQPTFLMSDRLWNERFNRNPDVIGTTMVMNGTARTLIAVLPPRFTPHNADLFFPTTITASSTDALIGGTGDSPLTVWVYAKLKPGVTHEQASANLEVIARNQAEVYPRRYPDQFRISIMSLANAYTSRDFQELVYILLVAVLMLLMIACSNVANLLLARATARETELALRASVGASRWRLIQLLLAESFVLAAAGATLGGLLAFAGIRWVNAAIPANSLPAETIILFSGRALAATVGVTLLTALLCGLAPALRAARGDLQRRLSTSGKGGNFRPGRGRLRTLLVAVQVTLAIVLLVGAGLMMRTLISIVRIDPGLDPTNVLTARLSFPQEEPRPQAQQVVFVRQVIDKIASLPGVIAASPAFGVPMSFAPSSPVAVPGTTPEGQWVSAFEFVGEDYFRAIGLPLIRGRVLSRTDVDGGRKVVVVNRRFVQDYLQGAEPLGRIITLAVTDRAAGPNGSMPFEIVGVVGDARNAGLQQEVRPQAFLPYTAAPFPASAIVVRTSTDPLAMQQSVRQQIWAVDRGVALMSVLTLEEVIRRDSLATPAFGAGLFGAFAVIGLILSAIGVFSVTAYTVALQTPDIAIRMALGAERRDVLWMVLFRALRPIVAGIVIGVGASYALSRFLESQVYGVTATDPATFAAVTTVIAIAGVVACLLPARRATRVNPLIAIHRR